MTKTTRIVCLCILGAVGTLCGVSTFNVPTTDDKTKTFSQLLKSILTANKTRPFSSIENICKL